MERKIDEELLLASLRMAKVGSWQVNLVNLDDWRENPSVWSDEIYRIFGYEPGTVDFNYGLFITHVHPDDVALVRGSLDEVMEPGRLYETEFRIILGDKTQKYIQERFEVIFDVEKKTPQRLVGICKDITERKESEREVKIFKHRLLTSQAIAHTGTWELEAVDSGHDLRFRTVFLSDETYRIFGYQPGEINITEDIFYKHVHPDDRQMVFDMIRKTVENDLIYDLEHRIILDDGTEKFIHERASVMRSDSGSIRVLGTCQDITDRKATEKRLKANQQMLLYSQELAKIGSWEINFAEDDIHKSSLVWSDESYRLFGYEPGTVEVSHKFFLDHVHPDDVHLVTGSMENLYKLHDYSTEFRILPRDGTMKTVFGRFILVFDEEKKIPVKMIGISQDITERKRMEWEMEQYNEKLRKAIEEQTRELRQINEDLDSFNFSISHDLRTPLRAMENYTAVLAANIDPADENAEYVGQLNNCVNELKGMIDSLLAFARYSKSELNKEMVDMKAMVEECFHSLTGSVAGDPPELRLNGIHPAYADPRLIWHVVCNLLSNAIKYSSKLASPSIEVGSIQEEQYTIYYVKDNGAGFDPDQSSKLFKPFSRLHSDSEFEGTGAGLAIAQRIIARHHGDIWAESKPKEGATFYFKLPHRNNGLH